MPRRGLSSKSLVRSVSLPLSSSPLTYRCNVCLDPATAEELGTVPEMGLAETKQAIDAASKAFKTWSKTTAKVRPYLALSHFACRAVVSCSTGTTFS